MNGTLISRFQRRLSAVPSSLAHPPPSPYPGHCGHDPCQWGGTSGDGDAESLGGQGAECWLHPTPAQPHGGLGQ